MNDSSAGAGSGAGSDGSSERPDSTLGGGELGVGLAGFGQFKDFIKKMIEVRNILKSAEMDTTLNLPSIVVIGSQSSGKSSVLESIVGHEFLPKGQNMVTRRPLELTLVNSPHCTRDYAVFAQQETGPVFDFAQVQKTLTEMNMAVPENQWISNKPIELTIYSKNVPDLSLVDLPGYIQINNRNQPPILRDKIRQLCEKYIREDNIILAVCAADVDLANAEALKASRAVDPEGRRTIGVITKLDLVDPAYSSEIVKNEDYPLRLGYVGVVCRPVEGQSGSRALGILGRRTTSSADSSNDVDAMHRYEDAYLREHQTAFEQVKDRVGIATLRDRLTQALEHSMAASLSSVLSSVQDELGEVKYVLKVEYSDRTISPEGYVSFLASSIKRGLENVARDYSRAKVREELSRVLQNRLLAVAEEALWGYADDSGGVDEQRVHQAVAMLTRSGVGRLAANWLVEAIIAQVKQTIKDGPLSHHPAAKERLLRQVELAMRTRCQTAIEQVENAIKPLKHELEYTDEDWRMARHKSIRLFKEAIAAIETRIDQLKKEVGPKRLRRIVQHLNDSSESADPDSAQSLALSSSPMLDKAKETVQLHYRLARMRKRLSLLERRECVQPESEGLTASESSSWIASLFGRGREREKEREGERERAREGRGTAEDKRETALSASRRGNSSIIVDENTPEARKMHVWNECQTRCPEIYLYMMTERLLSTAALHVHHELVHEFLHPFPDELAASLSSPSAAGLARKDILEFLEENPSVARHWRLQERRKILETVRDRLSYLQQVRPTHQEH